MNQRGMKTLVQCQKPDFTIFTDALGLPRGTEVVDVGIFAGNARSFIAVDSHSCLVRLASNAIEWQNEK
jgi:hypothetical protein